MLSSRPVNTSDLVGGERGAHWASMLSNRPMNASDLRGGQEDNFQQTRGRGGDDELPTLATSYITRYQGEWGTHVWASQHTHKQKMLACT